MKVVIMPALAINLACYLRKVTNKLHMQTVFNYNFNVLNLLIIICIELDVDVIIVPGQCSPMVHSNGDNHQYSEQSKLY